MSAFPDTPSTSKRLLRWPICKSADFLASAGWTFDGKATSGLKKALVILTVLVCLVSACNLLVGLVGLYFSHAERAQRINELWSATFDPSHPGAAIPYSDIAASFDRWLLVAIIKTVFRWGIFPPAGLYAMWLGYELLQREIRLEITRACNPPEAQEKGRC